MASTTDRAEPTVPAGGSNAPSWRSARRVCSVLILLFAVVFVVTSWATPIAPYATLKIDAECGSALFSPDGTMLVTSGKRDFGRTEGPLRVWDVAGGKERFSVAADWKAIETVLFSPDGSLLAAHEREGDLKIWNAKTGDEVATIKPVTHFGNWVNFCFSPDGRFLVLQDYSKGWPNKDYIAFWNIESKEEQGSVESHFWTLAFAPDGQSFATFRRQERGTIDEVLLWRMDKTPVLMKRHRITASVVAFWPDLTTFAAADDLPNGDGEVVMWDMATGDRCWSVTFNQHDTHLQTLSFMANGRVLAADGGGGTQLDWRWRTTLWDVTSAPTEIGSFAETPAVSPDGDLLAIPLDAGAKLLKVSAQERGTDLVVNGDGGASAFVSYNNMKFYPTPSFSPDSKMMVIKGLYRFSQEPLLARWLPRTLNPFRADPGGSVVHLWDTGSRRKVFTFRRCSDIWFSPDGQVLATLRDEAVDLWRVQRFGSLWHTLCRAGLVCLMVLPIGWLTWKALISRCFVAQGDKPGRSPIR